jgi:predicted nucleic acid-binding protein
MADARRCLVDTNILLRISRQSDPQHLLIGASLKALKKQGCELYYALQNVAEFWNVSTRPVEKNGYGLSIAQTRERVEYIERTMTLLPDSERVYSLWRRLVVDHNVRGVLVHDAHLVATVLAYDVSHILTLNQADFMRYSGVAAIHPSNIVSWKR